MDRQPVFVTTGNNADNYLPRKYVEKDVRMKGSLNRSSIPSKLLFGLNSDSDSLSPGPTNTNDKPLFVADNDNPGTDTGYYNFSIQKSNRRIKHEKKHKNIEIEINKNFIILSDIVNSIQKYEYIPKARISLFSKTLGKNLDLLKTYKGNNLNSLKAKHNSFNEEHKDFRKNHTSYWRKNEPSKNITRKFKSQ
jgi:hypothetical protein